MRQDIKAVIYRAVFFTAFLLAAVSCGEQEPVALGTLEWDRIALPAPVAEKIVNIRVREGQRVVPGQILLELDPQTTSAQLRAAEAEVARQVASLEELNDGPRQEEIARASASLDAARAEARDRQADFRRLQALGEKNYASRSDIDAAQASAESAEAQVRVAQEQLLELQRGTRIEEIQQGQAALAQARAQAQAQRALLEKLTVRAPQPGIVDSIPFKLGDEAPLGASLVIMLTGETPYARVYVPQPMRLQVEVGGEAQVYLEGIKPGRIKNGNDVADSVGPYPGTVRMVRNEPSFTPYYALTGDDATRLSYIAEIQLEADAARLPAGLPLKAEFAPSRGAGAAHGASPVHGAGETDVDSDLHDETPDNDGKNDDGQYDGGQNDDGK